MAARETIEKIATRMAEGGKRVVHEISQGNDFFVEQLTETELS
jgi:hypothetical protein